MRFPSLVARNSIAVAPVVSYHIPLRVARIVALGVGFWSFSALLAPSLHAQASNSAAANATPTWEPDSLGNHRAVVHVGDGGDAVWVRLPWKRRDAKPEQVAIIVMDARTQLRVSNTARMEITRDYGDIVFQPRTAPGDYFIYYLPYTGTFKSNYPKITYRPPDDRPDQLWMGRNALTAENARLKRWQSLPQATVKRFESFDAFSAFTPMEY
ncbi:MAG: glycoside hydrolase domain-containing protein, partial [Gemmatimonadaceae bacterium]